MRLEALTSSFLELAKAQTPILDVRAPVEFEDGHLPNSINMAILNDQERSLVGTTYKEQGSDAAISLGHKLVSGQTKQQRVDSWLGQLRLKPETVITCFRGGMRSALAQQWLKEAGVECTRIEGGYKAMRTFYLEQLQSQPARHSWRVLAGATGSGKTRLLRELPCAKIDLEQLANHRGSAFGAHLTPQPSQASFENALAQDFVLRANQSSLLIEDESRMVGARVLPQNLYHQMQNSPLIVIEESLESRVELTFQEYIENSDLNGLNGEPSALRQLQSYATAIEKISPKLGGQRTKEILSQLRLAQKLEDHKLWIRRLLQEYYDPSYQSSMERRKPQIILRATRAEILNQLQEGL